MSFSYASDFPTLPDAAPASAPTAKQTHVWSRPTLSKSEVNITFRLASDERSNKVKSFGSTSEESKKAQAIATATSEFSQFQRKSNHLRFQRPELNSVSQRTENSLSW